MFNEHVNGAETRNMSEKAAPIHEVQAGGWLMDRGSPATHLTEPVQLETGQNQETIQFVIAPKMTEVVILGLCWLGKWGPTIWWQMGEKKMNLGKRLPTPMRALGEEAEQ